MIGNLRELTRRVRHALVVRNVYFQKRRFAARLQRCSTAGMALFCDFFHGFATSFCISRTNEHVKFFCRELSRYFVANPLVRSSYQHRLHVLFIEFVGIFCLKKILQQRLGV